MFGNLGFPFFDKERKAFMGTALAVTVFAIFITVFGCFALSDSNRILHFTAFGVASLTFIDSQNQTVGQVAYLGLRKFVVDQCLNSTRGTHPSGKNFMHWTQCTSYEHWWEDTLCDGENSLSDFADDDFSFYGFPCYEIEKCRKTSIKSQFGAFMTAVTLIFALNGCLTRIRKVAVCLV